MPEICAFAILRHMSLSINQTSIADLKIIDRQRVEDHRGFLSRLFCIEELESEGWQKEIAQINHTCTRKRGTVRGLHYQMPPHSEMKLVTCIRGEVWDVAVDLRKNSPTFLEFFGVTLSDTNMRSLLIPEGFAHGFQTTTDDVEMIYCHSHTYQPAFEKGLSPRDQTLAIPWPEAITIISDRDNTLPIVGAGFEGLSF